MQKDKKEFRTRINKWIKAPEVKVLLEDGTFIGVMETYKALKLAQEKGLDLVEVNGKVSPVLVQIVEFGKFKYDSKKKQKEEKKKQKVISTKSLFIHLTTQENDLIRTIEQARKFLLDGNRVSYTIKLRGREMVHKDLAEEKLKWVIEQLKADISGTSPISLENRDISTLLSPK